MNVWRVNYTTVFSSSSGMRSYTNAPEDHTALVLTYGVSITDVREALGRRHDNQTQVTVKDAHWLGFATQ